MKTKKTVDGPQVLNIALELITKRLEQLEKINQALIKENKAQASGIAEVKKAVEKRSEKNLPFFERPEEIKKEEDLERLFEAAKKELQDKEAEAEAENPDPRAQPKI